MQPWECKWSVKQASHLRPQHQSVHALVVAFTNIRSSGYENSNNLFVPLLCCTHKRCRPLLVRFIDKRVGFDEKLYDFGMPCAKKGTTGQPGGSMSAGKSRIERDEGTVGQSKNLGCRLQQPAKSTYRNGKPG